MSGGYTAVSVNSDAIELSVPVSEPAAQIVESTEADNVVINVTRRLSAEEIRVVRRESEQAIKLGDEEYHKMSSFELFQKFGTSKNGLSTAKAEELLLKWGRNEITPAVKRHWFVKFLFTLVGGFQLMLWFGSILCFIVYGISQGTDIQTLALAVVLIMVIFVTCIFQAYQEGKSDEVMAALKALAPSTVYCFRDGVLVEIDCWKLVPGDIVQVRKYPSFLLVLLHTPPPYPS